MGSGGNNAFTIVVFMCTLFCAVMFLAGFFMPNWSKNTDIESNEGLWVYCEKADVSSDKTTCVFQGSRDLECM